MFIMSKLQINDSVQTAKKFEGPTGIYPAIHFPIFEAIEKRI